MTDKTVSAYAKGVLGEARALEYLCAKGMMPLAERYHSPFGEIDLVLRDGDTLVFAEVKVRERGCRYEGANAVNPIKRKRIVLTARCYLGEHPHDGSVRFDVVEITRDGVLHIADAFQGHEW